MGNRRRAELVCLVGTENYVGDTPNGQCSADVRHRINLYDDRRFAAMIPMCSACWEALTEQENTRDADRQNYNDTYR